MKNFLWMLPLTLSMMCLSSMLFSLNPAEDLNLEKYELYITHIECDSALRKGKYHLSIELNDGSNLILSKRGICEKDEFQRFKGLRANVLKYDGKIFDLSVGGRQFLALQEKVDQINGIFGGLGLLFLISTVIIYRINNN